MRRRRCGRRECWELAATLAPVRCWLFSPRVVETAPTAHSTALGVEVQQGATGEADGKLRGGEGGRGEEGVGG